MAKITAALKTIHVVINKKTTATVLTGARKVILNQQGRTMAHTIEFTEEEVEILQKTLTEFLGKKHND